MAARHVVVDGSNLATEGRSMPSLSQLDQAVREFLTENPDDMVIVVVDASFGHRIDPSELKLFEEAEAAGELVSPPAGAIGRGDAFLLRIADKTGATVLSNDSFQEFHGDYDWLFERGRLIGGKPVPGVGWIFTPRTPVRGPRSREAVKEAKRKTSVDPESTMPGLDLAAERAKTTKGKGRKNVERAIAVALEEVVAPKEKLRRPRKGSAPPAEPVNDPLTFITFIAAHPLGGEVMATVESFASHGAFVECEGARCYVPLSAMGEPAPKSAREVFTKGEQVAFVVQALDPQRRGVELALPGFAKIAGAPTEETVAAEIEAHEDDEEAAASVPVATPAKRSRKKAAAAADSPEPVPAAAPAATSRQAPAKKAPAATSRQAPAKKAPAATSRQAPAQKAPAATRKRAPAQKVPAARVEDAELASPPQLGTARTRTARKVAAAARQGGPVPEAAPDPEVEAAAGPTPARRRSRAAKAAPQPSAVAAPRPRRSPVAKAASVSEPSAVAAPRPRRSPVAKAASVSEPSAVVAPRPRRSRAAKATSQSGAAEVPDEGPVDPADGGS